MAAGAAGAAVAPPASALAPVPAAVARQAVCRRCRRRFVWAMAAACLAVQLGLVAAVALGAPPDSRVLGAIADGINDALMLIVLSYIGASSLDYGGWPAIGALIGRRGRAS